MIDLKPHAVGTLLPVRAQPGARKNEVRGEHQGMLKVCVTQAPEKGKANKALVAVLAKELSLRKSQITLLTGETSSQKQFLVEGLTPGELAERIGPKLA